LHSSTNSCHNRLLLPSVCLPRPWDSHRFSFLAYHLILCLVTCRRPPFSIVVQVKHPNDATEIKGDDNYNIFHQGSHNTITVSVHPDKLKDIGQPAYDESMKHHAIKSNQNKFQHNTISCTNIRWVSYSGMRKWTSNELKHEPYLKEERVCS